MTPEVAAAALTEASRWVWDVIGEDLTDKTKDLLKRQWQKFEWRKAEQAYRASLLEQYGSIRILGKSDPVKLEGIFTDVFTLDEVTARRRYDIDELRKSDPDRFELGRQTQKRVNGVELVRKGGNLFILGKPGAGKSTFLKYMTLQAVQNKLDKTPVFISLKEFSMAKMDALLPFLVQQFALCHFPDSEPFIKQLLIRGKALVLFDGLDEINQERDERRNLTRLLQNFSREYSQSQCLITCRIAASDYQFENFQDVEIADFTRDQVHSFATKWFAGQEIKQEKFIEDLYKDENKGLRELCAVPLLLSMLCLAFDETMSFPQRRAELYDDALDALLRKWDTSRSIERDTIYRGLSHKRKQQMFAQIAAPTFEKGNYFLTRHFLEKQIVAYLEKLPRTDNSADIDGYVVLKAIEAQHSIFVERAKDIYSFSHLTFQEYFTGKYIVENEARNTTTRLIRNHLTDNRWREVFLLTASLLDNADDFLTELRQVIDELVADDPVLEQMLTWADQKAIVSKSSDTQRHAARLAYIFLARALERTFDLVFDLAIALDRAIDLVPAFELARTLDLARYRTLDFAHDLALARAFELAREQAFDLIGDIAHNYTFDLALDFALLYAWQMASIFGAVNNFIVISQYAVDYQSYWDKVVARCSQSTATELAVALAALQVPTRATGQTSWNNFVDELQGLMEIYRDIGHEFLLSSKQIDKLNIYLGVNELLVQCLKLAVVDDRRSFEDNLLLLLRHKA